MKTLEKTYLWLPTFWSVNHPIFLPLRRSKTTQVHQYSDRPCNDKIALKTLPVTHTWEYHSICSVSEYEAISVAIITNGLGYLTVMRDQIIMIKVGNFFNLPIEYACILRIYIGLPCSWESYTESHDFINILNEVVIRKIHRRPSSQLQYCVESVKLN